MYVFDFVASIWGLESWNFSPKLEKHTFYSVKMYVFDFGAPIWSLESWNFSPKLEKHTFYSVNVCFFKFGMIQTCFFQKTSFDPKTYILHCKMYVFGPGASIWGLEFWNFSPKLEKHTFYSVKCMFLTLGLQFEAWNLEISVQNWKNIHFTV